MSAIIQKIEQLKKEKNAVILAHYYTLPEVQKIADFVGDSLALARYAVNTDADIILFAGVHFMAETSKILNPTKKVLIPDMEAHCSLADSCPAEELELFLKDYPNHVVLSYINCSAQVKALSDIIVTSSNALKIVNALPKDQKIVFTPDRNLGAYINSQTGKEMVLWDGACHVHDRLNVDQLVEMKEKYPHAKVLAHPECRGTVLALADFIGSTTAMLNYSEKDDTQEYIVATETGILYEMQKRSPHKKFYLVQTDTKCNCNDCEFMKLSTLSSILSALENEKPEILLDSELMEKAKKSILKMLELS
ncbi:MAG TPA: quinolinate synthase NadA [Bacteroidales bacterium]|nr:quinolinate synthase NadA [Bacteroidales bacterium]HOH21907.1 quinolinate synthase NadA [Bacteroidales bacterium]HPB57311.1 quinolinate synthase NadA [Bacteroidales bacterium]HPZ03170.1 quinolinate synthase NadA [Bacteroidales bacterium]HQB74583.1 quinolinate synthase NadA [Bacteroidales bacterium]